MKNEDIKYNKFISKYNQFQEEIQKTNQFLIQIQSFFNQQIKQIDSLTKKLNEQNKYLINEEKINNKDYIYIVIKLINETFESMMNLDKRIIMELLTNLTKLIDNIKKDNKKYDSELETIYNQIQEEKEKMGIQKKLFYDSTLEVEKNVLDKLDSLYKKKDYSNEFLNSLELSKEPKINYINYKNSIEKLNEKIKELNNKEKFFLEQKENIYNTLNEFTTNILNLFYENQYIKNNLLSKNRTIIKEMIISNNNSILKNKSKSNILNKYCLDLTFFRLIDRKYMKGIRLPSFLNKNNQKSSAININFTQKDPLFDISNYYHNNHNPSQTGSNFYQRKQIKGLNIDNLLSEKRNLNNNFIRKKEPENQNKNRKSMRRDPNNNKKRSNYTNTHHSCPKYESSSPEYDNFCNEALQAHNNYRKIHHTEPLKLNRELCKIAQNYSEHLANVGRLQHSDNNYHNDAMGENLYCCFGKDPTGSSVTSSWYSEIKNYNYSGDWSNGTGHFTQIVWKETKEVGFGKAKDQNGKTFVVANYYPAGNVLGFFKYNVLRP